MKKILTLVVVVLISWSGFSQSNKLTFQEAVKIGLEKNVTLNQQKNQLTSTQAQRLGGYGNFLPNFNITGAFQRQEGQQQNTTSGDLEDLTTDYFGAQLNANLTVFNGLRNVNTLFQTSNQLMAQGYLVKRSAQDVVSTVATQYLQVLLDQELMRIAEENLKTQKTLLAQIQGFYDVGSKAITDVYNQDALTKAAQVTYIRARNTLQNDKSILAQTLQMDPADGFEVVYPQVTEDIRAYANVSLDSLISIAEANRADLQQFRYQEQANKYLVRTTLSGFTPSVSLFANYGSFYYSLIPDNFNTQFRTLNPSLSYGANFTIPLFSRFQNKSQRVTAKVTYNNSVLNRQNVEKTVRLDVQRAHNNLVNAIENYESSLAQFQAGELALQTQTESYALGISAQVAVAQANQTYVSGAAAKAQAEVTLLFQKVMMEYALGILQPETIEMK